MHGHHADSGILVVRCLTRNFSAEVVECHLPVSESIPFLGQVSLRRYASAPSSPLEAMIPLMYDNV